MITREELEERIAALRKMCEHHLNQYNAHLGAIGDCAYWLQALKDGEGEAPENPNEQDSPSPS